MTFPINEAWYMHGYGWYTEAQVKSSCKQYGWRMEDTVVIGIEGIPVGWKIGHKPENYTIVTFPLGGFSHV